METKKEIPLKNFRKYDSSNSPLNVEASNAEYLDKKTLCFISFRFGIILKEISIKRVDNQNSENNQKEICNCCLKPQTNHLLGSLRVLHAKKQTNNEKYIRNYLFL